MSTPSSLRSAVYGELYCKRLLASVTPDTSKLGAVGAVAAAILAAGPASEVRTKACSPLAGNSDVSVRGFDLEAPYWRMIDVLPTADLHVDTVAFYCERASEIGAAVGLYGEAGRLLASSGQSASRSCSDGDWLDVPIAPEVTLEAGKTYYIAHLHTHGTWHSARGTGNQFCKTRGMHFYTRYTGSSMPLHRPEVKPFGDGPSDEVPLVLKSCGRHEVDKNTEDALAELEDQVRRSHDEQHRLESQVGDMQHAQAANKQCIEDIEELKATNKQQIEELKSARKIQIEELKAAHQHQIEELKSERARLTEQFGVTSASLHEAQEETLALRNVLTGEEAQEQTLVHHGGQANSAISSRHGLWAEGDSEGLEHKYAFVMLSYIATGSTEESLWGVLPMAVAIRRMSNYPLVLFTNSTILPDGSDLRTAMGKLNVRVLPVHNVDIPHKIQASMLMPRWKYAYWKLQVWKLTQYERLIWLDSDTFLTRSIDWLFDRPWMWAQRDDWFCKQNQTGVCSGVMLLYPSLEDYDGLLRYADTLDELKDGDQQLISMYFANVRGRPVNLLSDAEASFGQCLGRAASPYLNLDGSNVTGMWSMPTLVHKSGGWANTNNNEYANMCLSHNLSLQLFMVGDATINVCQYHPLGAFWRELFCDAARDKLDLKTLDAQIFCSDACWYRGGNRKLQTVDGDIEEIDTEALHCSRNATVRLHDYYAHVVGHPFLQPRAEKGLPPPPPPGPPPAAPAGQR